MASVMGICGGLVGPKSGNVEKPLVFVCFFDVFKNRGDSKNGSGGARRSVLTSKKWSEGEKWSRKTLDGKCDGYMWGLGGAKKRKC